MNDFFEKDGRVFYLVDGDPILGRGSFKANHAGQLARPHGLSVLDASRLPKAKLAETLGAALAEGREGRGGRGKAPGGGGESAHG